MGRTRRRRCMRGRYGSRHVENYRTLYKIEEKTLPVECGQAGGGREKESGEDGGEEGRVDYAARGCSSGSAGERGDAHGSESGSISKSFRCGEYSDRKRRNADPVFRAVIQASEGRYAGPFAHSALRG